MAASSAGAAPEVPVVRCLKDAFAWPFHAMQTVGRCFGEAAGGKVKAALHNNRLSISTCFSGVDTPGVAIDMLAAELARANCDSPAGNAYGMRSLHAVDMLEESRFELMMLPTPPECIYKNVLDFLNPAVAKTMVAACTTLTHDDICELIHVRSDVVVAEGPCLIHGRCCQMTSATFHVAGTPCVDYSNMGARRKANGPTNLAFLVWAGLRRLLRETFIIHENVPQFPVSILEQALGDLYIWHTAITTPVMHGWPVERRRRISIGILREKLHSVAIPWKQTPAVFRRDRECDWVVFFIASPEEIQAEVEWAAGRNNIPESEDDVPAHLRSLWAKSAHTKSLNLNELENLLRYTRLAPYEAYMLNQSASFHGQHSNNGAMCCLTKGCGIVISARHWRWLTPFEVLLAQGFPVYPNLSDAGCSFRRSRAEYGLPERKRHTPREQGGNAMHTNVMGVAFLWCFTQVSLRQQDEAEHPAEHPVDVHRKATASRATERAQPVEESIASDGFLERSWKMRKMM